MSRPKRIGFVTCRAMPSLTPDDEGAARELERRGLRVRALPWDDSRVPWSEADALVLRSCRDYQLRPDEFEAWLDRLGTAGVPAWNPAPAVRWNMDRRYLRLLEEAGVDVFPTVWILRHEPLELEEVMDDLDCHELLVRPVVPTSAYQTLHVSWATLGQDQRRFERLAACRELMVQPLLPDALSGGVWSLVFLDRHFSHAVVRRASTRESHLWPEGEGRREPGRPDPVLLDTALRALEAVEGDLLYARVDVVPLDGRGLLLDLELIEPCLYLASDPAGARRFGDALERRLAV